MTLDEPTRARFREAAASLEGIDHAAYEAVGRDPLEPIIGLGPADAPVGLFGRDPGREEVRHGIPFIGSGGQKVREVLHRHHRGSELPGFDASVAVGRHYFWANTVPYKPAGNRAWSMAVKRRFHPLMADLLVHHWRGRTLITLGREAFLWFGIGRSREERRELEGFWQRDDRFSACCEATLATPDGGSARFRLCPLPHPSPLNATWYRRFPGLLQARLQQLELLY
ncbi:uracil-DNA glycosylase family protein [Arhodomonas sp. SL1]|uniref:uracil-DNA glycosylase family protein n=1 Tax=Arhodomonas sp. SL1 TaxID=3425691 RepID=UPI003F8819D8